MAAQTGKYILQIPKLTKVPERVLRDTDMSTIDHRGPEFAQLGLEMLESVTAIFCTKNSGRSGNPRDRGLPPPNT